MSFETCRHVKEDGAYCGSPALRDQKYCHYHLRHRERRLRRARALRDNVPYRLELSPLEDLDAVQVALSEIVLAIGSGQLEYHAAGRMLYGIQQLTSVLKFKAKLQATQSATADDAAVPPPPAKPQRVEECPEFNRELGLKPGIDIDAEIAWTLQKADESADLRNGSDLPTPPPGVQPGTARYKLFCEEAFQEQRYHIHSLREQLRDYHEQQRKENTIKTDKLRKEMLSAGSPASSLAETA